MICRLPEATYEFLLIDSSAISSSKDVMLVVFVSSMLGVQIRKGMEGSEDTALGNTLFNRVGVRF